MNLLVTSNRQLAECDPNGGPWKGILLMRPCPFCGGEAEIYTKEFSDYGYISCKYCGCTIREYRPDIVDLVKAWNKRKGE